MEANERVIPEDLQRMYVYASMPEPKNNWAGTVCKTHRAHS